jgi:hypothetical protein
LFSILTRLLNSLFHANRDKHLGGDKMKSLKTIHSKANTKIREKDTWKKMFSHTLPPQVLRW